MSTLPGTNSQDSFPLPDSRLSGSALDGGMAFGRYPEPRSLPVQVSRDLVAPERLPQARVLLLLKALSAPRRSEKS